MASPLVLHQSDHEVAAVGPILNPDGTYYVPAVGDTTTLVTKAAQWVADAAGITYAGTFTEDATKLGQWWATFTVPPADLQVIGKFFFRCKVINSLGQPQTVVGGDLIVDPGRNAQRASTTTAPVLNLDAIALAATYLRFLQAAMAPDLLIVGAITRDANGVATSAPVVWPDGSPGTYTATTVSTAFPGAVDAYTITYGSPVTRTYTQPTVTRDSNGAVTNRPAIVVT